MSKEIKIYSPTKDFIRTYSEKVHGKNFEKLARGFVRKVEGRYAEGLKAETAKESKERKEVENEKSAEKEVEKKVEEAEKEIEKSKK